MVHIPNGFPAVRCCVCYELFTPGTDRDLDNMYHVDHIDHVGHIDHIYHSDPVSTSMRCRAGSVYICREY